MYSKCYLDELDGDGGLRGIHWTAWVEMYMEANPEAKKNFGYHFYRYDYPLESVESDLEWIVHKLETKHTFFYPFGADRHAYLVILTADSFYVYVNGDGPVPRRAARLYEALQKTEKKRAFVEIRSPVQRGGMDCIAFTALMATTWMAGTKFTEEVAAREIPEFRGKLKKYMLEANAKERASTNNYINIFA